MVVKIIILKDEKPIDQLVMDKDTLIIGRKSESDIVIKDPAVSGFHAKVQRVGDKTVVADNGSTNGVHVKGKRVQQHVVRNNDTVVIGEHSLKFVITGEANAKPGTVRTSPAAEGPGQKKEPSPEALAKARQKLQEQRRAAARVKQKAGQPAPKTPAKQAGGAAPSGDGALIVSGGANDGQCVSLAEPLNTIGEAGVQVAAVSKRPSGHFIIHVDGGKDRDRVPLVNGEPIGFKARRLEVGDRVEVAGIEMGYTLV